MNRKTVKKKISKPKKIVEVDKIVKTQEVKVIVPPKEPTITLLYLGNNTLPYTIYDVVCNPTGEFPKSIGMDLNRRSPNKWKIKKG